MKKTAKTLLVFAIIAFILFAIGCVAYVIIYPETYNAPAPRWVNTMALLWVIPMTIGVMLLLIVNRQDIYRDIKKFINS